jgi:hypothetical protein
LGVRRITGQIAIFARVFFVIIKLDAFAAFIPLGVAPSQGNSLSAGPAIRQTSGLRCLAESRQAVQLMRRRSPARQ